MKTKEELDALKEEVDAVRKKLRELTPDELDTVVGGGKDGSIFDNKDPYNEKEIHIYENKTDQVFIPEIR